MPILCCAPAAGVLVDRVSRHRLLIATQTILMLLALMVATLIAARRISVHLLMVFAAGVGLVSAFDVPAIAAALGLFAISLGVWCWAFAVALARTTRGDDVVVASMFLVQGPAPKRVRVHLFGSLAVCIALTAATAVAEPFGVLVPMLPLGLLGLWGARHGVFPPRRMPDASEATGKRRSSGRAGE